MGRSLSIYRTELYTWTAAKLNAGLQTFQILQANSFQPGGSLQIFVTFEKCYFSSFNLVSFQKPH